MSNTYCFHRYTAKGMMQHSSSACDNDCYNLNPRDVHLAATGDCTESLLPSANLKLGVPIPQAT